MLYLAALFFILFSGPAAADNVILMLADGMGFNHVSCAGKEKDLFFLPCPSAAKSGHIQQTEA